MSAEAGLLASARAAAAPFASEEVGALETPALVLDFARLSRNLAEMAELCATNGKQLRPHAKAHKTIEIAQRQLDLGAAGITVAKLGEAEVYAAAGVRDIFVCYPIVGEAKLKRLLALSRIASISTIVDGLAAAEQLAAAFAAQDRTIDVLIKLDLGMHRVGVEEKEVRRLAHRLAAMPGLELAGVCIHEGETYGEPDPARRRSLARRRVSRLVETAQELRTEGLPIQRVSCGATPSVFEVLDIKGVTEVRPGNYVFYDATQVALGVVDRERCALSLLATVVSHSGPERAIIDAGAKALSLDRGAHGLESLAGFGTVCGRPGISLAALSEEHGWLQIARGEEVAVGERLEIVPNHACPVVNNFESLAVVERGAVLDRWPVAARGLMS